MAIRIKKSSLWAQKYLFSLKINFLSAIIETFAEHIREPTLCRIADRNLKFTKCQLFLNKRKKSSISFDKLPSIEKYIFRDIHDSESKSQNSPTKFVSGGEVGVLPSPENPLYPSCP